MLALLGQLGRVGLGNTPAAVSPGTIAAAGVNQAAGIVQTVAPSGGSGSITAQLYRHTSSPFTPPGEGTLVSGTLPFIDAPLTNGVTYYYRVLYSDAIAQTALSNTASATPASTVAIEVDWGHSQGQSNNALMDGQEYFNNLITCGTGYLNVISVGDAPAGATTDNAFTIAQQGDTNCGNIEMTTALTQNTSHYGRFYFQLDNPSADEWVSAHGVCYNASGSLQGTPFRLQYPPSYNTGIAIGCRHVYNVNSGNVATPAYFGFFWYNNTVTQGNTYRFEWNRQYHDVAGSAAGKIRHHMRVYNSAGTLIATNDDFRDTNNSQTLTAWYAEGNYFGVTSLDEARQFSMGQEGPSGAAESTAVLRVWDLAFSYTTWVGA